MSYIDSIKVRSFFDMLNNSEICYLLIKNNDDYLPDRLSYLKDIDILIHPKDKSLFHKVMKQNGYLYNPYFGISRRNGYTFLYPMDDGEWFVKDKMIIEVFYQLNVHALEDNTFLPLDEKINNNIWINRKWDNDKRWYCMDEETLLVYLIARSIFDKKEFTQTYRNEIKKRFYLLHEKNVINQLKLIFFKYTDKLIYLLEKEKFDEIIPSYLQFCDY